MGKSDKIGKKCIPAQQYPYSIQQFAWTLFGYSKKAYNYVREILDDASRWNIVDFKTHTYRPVSELFSFLAETTIKNWMNKIDGAPGFSAQLSEMASQQEKLAKKVNTEWKFWEGWYTTQIPPPLPNSVLTTLKYCVKLFF